jgi:hypothetical protein
MTEWLRIVYSFLACLRGPVNRGAEKEKDPELPEKSL